MAEQRYTRILLDSGQSFRFNDTMLNARVSFANLDTNLSITSAINRTLISLYGLGVTYQLNSTSFQAVISEVQNSLSAILNTTFKADVSYVALDGTSGNTLIEITDFNNAPFTITYDTPVVDNVVSKTRSYARVDVDNLRNFSGKLKTIEVWTRPTATSVDQLGYQKYYEQDITTSELFASESGETFTNVNYQHKLTNGFSTASYTVTSASPRQIVTASSAFGLLVTSSDYKTNGIKFALNYSTQTIYNFSKLILSPNIAFSGDNVYKLTMDVRGNTSSSTGLQTDGIFLELYASGSAFSNNLSDSELASGEPFYDLRTQLSRTNVDVTGNYIFGEFLGKLTIPTETTNKDFGRIEITFKPSITGSGFGQIFLVSNWGTWDIANISLSAKDNSQYTFFVPIRNAVQLHSDRLDFQLKFKNEVGEDSKVYTYDYDNLFVGENWVFDGGNNFLPGTIFVGGGGESGIQIGGSGLFGSSSFGYVKSVGYKGYEAATNTTGPPGFILYSGSSDMSASISSSEDYNAVGLELNAGGGNGRMRFKASGSNSIFEVYAKSFFVGSTSSQFISGANNVIEISSSQFHLSSSGNVYISGSINALSGRIGGFNISTDSLSSTNIFLSGSPTTASGYASSANMFISTSNFNVKSNGDLTASNFLMSGGRITSNVTIEGSLSANSIATPVGGPYLAEINSQGYARFVSASIGGWNVNDTSIYSSGIVIASTGSIKSSNYISNLSGWVITSDLNGYAEFENAKIRGTLKTVVFEKETINAVGGQLWVANATTLTGSVSASEQTMSVQNVSGFSPGEILLIKKTGNTGFSTEYVYINSSSRNTTGTGSNDYTGKLYVTRGYGSGSLSDTIFGFTSSISESYTDGQVLVSTGKTGSGWIRLNSYPNDTTTPYIDIVERTGSGIYDFTLAARIGDLSGLAGNNLVFGTGSPGFGLASQNVYLTGGIRATFGNIGGWSINSSSLSSANIFISGSPTASSGYASPANMFISTSNFNVKSNGDITASSFLLTGGTITSAVTILGSVSANAISTPASGSPLALITSEGYARFVSASIGGWNVNADSLYTQNVIISSSGGGKVAFGSTIPVSLTSGNGIFISGSGEVLIGSASGYRIQFINGALVLSSSAFMLGGPNSYISSSGNAIVISSSNFAVDATGNLTASNVRLSGNISASSGNIGGFGISQDAIYGATFYLSGAAAGNGFFISSSKFNVKATGDITGSQVLFTGGTIGGFTITPTTITASNILINSNGTIQTSNYVSNFSGWTLSSAANGYLEVENAKIRGTLSTTVFEKETINAVGGQLWISNATVLSSSVSASQTTMSVANASGFVAGEILLIKKTGDTGFSSEYVLIQSTSRDTTATGGFLYVTRGYASGSFPSSSLFNFTSSTAQAYSEGQVLVSTGVSQSGWIRLNANPSDTTTPYIDIVERTGSGIYDYLLTARLGDLSGVANTSLVLGTTNPGFGLASQNVYLTGGIIATFGKIANWHLSGSTIVSSNRNVHISSSNGGIISLGVPPPAQAGSGATGTGVFLSGSGYVLLGTSGAGRLEYTPGGNLFLSSSNFTLGNPSGERVSLTGAGEDVLLQLSSSNFILGNYPTDFIMGRTGLLAVWASNFYLRSGQSGIYISSSKGGQFAMGAELPTTTNFSVTSGSGIFLSGSGEALIGSASGYRIQFVGGNLILSSSNFKLGGTSYISSSGAGIVIVSPNFNLDSAGNVSISGSITASAGKIGGFSISSESIYTSTVNISSSAGGVISLGSTPPVALAGVPSGSGIYLSGSGRVLIGNSAGESIKWTENGLLNISSSTFFLGNASAFIQGASGVLTLRSANFTLNATTINITSSDGGAIALGKTVPTSVTSGNGIFLSGSGDVLFGSASGYRVQFVNNNLVLSSSAFMLGGPNSYISSSGNYIVISSSNFAIDASGSVTASNVRLSGNISASSGNIGGFNISQDALSGATFYLSGAAAGNGIFISSSNFNIKASGDVTGSKVLFTGGTIGGFTITPSTITASNILINSNGTIQTSNYVSNFSGWILSSAANGYLEVENAKVRGTLSTTVFEKETINAVGGQLWISNATVLSASVSASETTMSVANVSGFVAGEILLVKKTGDTGFSSEYIRIVSSSRDTTATGGFLYVTRAYASGSFPSSSLFNFTASSAQAYSEGQVLVSTGVSQSGWIRLNANPTDTTTPYIDIVERTGSGIYDYLLTARLGDLSGVANTSLVLGATNPGFGLASQNVYLTGGIFATFGRIASWHISGSTLTSAGVHISSSEGGVIKLGASIPTSVINGVGVVLSGSGEALIGNSSGSRIQFVNNNLTLSASSFVLGNSTSYISSSNSGLVISSSNFTLGGATSYISSSAAGLIISSANFYLDVNGNLTASNIRLTGSISANSGSIAGWTITTEALSKSSATISSSAGGVISLGTPPPTASGGSISGTGIYLSGSGRAMIGNSTGSRVEFDPSNGYMLISSSAFLLGNGAGARIQLIGNEGGGSSTILISSSNVLLGKFPTDFLMTRDDGLFAIWASNFYLRSGQSGIYISSSKGGQFAMGAELPTTTNFSVTSGSGIFLSGSGEALIGSASGYRIQFVGGNLILSSSAFKLGGNNSFISSSGTSFVITSSNFAVDATGNLTASNVRLSGNISASSGNIGGFTISADALTGNSFYISGSPTAPLGYFISASNFNVKQNGQITASTILVDGGSIGGFTVTPTRITASNLIISSDGTLQSANYASNSTGWILSAAGNGYVEVENAKIRGTLSTTVFEKETINAVGGQLWVANATVLSASVSASETTMSVQNAYGFVPGEILMIKKTGDIGFSTEYVVVNSSSFTSYYTATSNTVYTTASAINQSGTGTSWFTTGSTTLGVTDAVYATGGVGTAGTKWLVLTNLLYSVPSSATIIGVECSITSKESLNTPPLQVTASLVSASVLVGSVKSFTGTFNVFTNNVLGSSADLWGATLTPTIVNNSGFGVAVMATGSNTGDALHLDSVFVKVYYTNPSSNTPGYIYVTRGYGNTSMSNAMYNLTSSVSQSYTEGQVIVSTGTTGTGWIRINAMPTDTTTPYIDIVERTGSGIFDFNLVSRLGDLSGLSGNSMVFGTGSPGFGLASQNVYLTGGIRANFGYIGGWTINTSSLSSANMFISGAPLAGGVDDPRYMFISTSKFNVKQNGDITASAFFMSGGVIASNVIICGSVSANSISTPAGGPYLAQIDSTGYARFVSASIGSWNINNTSLFTPTAIINGGQSSSISLGNPPPSAGVGIGIFLSGSGEAMIGSSSGYRVQFLSGSLILSSSNFKLGNTSYISSSGNSFIITSSNFSVDSAGNLTASNAQFSGSILTSTGYVGGWYVTSSGLIDSLSNQSIQLSSSQGVISIGSPPPVKTTTGASGSGIYLSGSGYVMIGTSTGSRIEYNPTTTNVIISSSQFMFGDPVGSRIQLYPSGLMIISSSEFVLGTGLFTTDGEYIQGANNRLVIFAKNFYLRSTDANSNGIFVTSSNLGQIYLGRQVTTKNVTNGYGVFLSGSGEVLIGDSTGSRIQFVGGNLILSASSFKLGGASAYISSSGLSFVISSSNFSVGDSGSITASNVRLSGNISASSGNIGGFGITTDSLSSTGIFISGSASAAISYEHPSNMFISTSGFNIKSNGDITASRFFMSGGTLGGNVTILGSVTADSIATPIGGGGSGPGGYKAVIDVNGYAYFESASIAGWSINTSSIYTSGTVGIIIDAAGKIQSSNYVRDTHGWLLTSDYNGYAEFENVKIRGTLSTTVFEKESVNAVGGQLWVANATVLSASVSASETTMSVANSYGFVPGEILMVKKTGDIGFSTEYIKVVSSSFDGYFADNHSVGPRYTYASDTVQNTNIVSSGSGQTWLTPYQAATGSGNYATCAFSATPTGSKWLKAVNFSTASNGTGGGGTTAPIAIPTSSTVVGVIASIRGRALSTDNNIQITASLVSNSFTTGSYKSFILNSTGGAYTTTLGSETDTWGIELTPAIVNATSSFGFALIASGTSDTAQIDEMSIYVYYTTPAAYTPGKLYVVRGYSSSYQASTGFNMTSSTSQSYTEGQVLVSTGASGSGWIRINSAPTDTTTPYMDIVERTGSGIFDYQIKARLGDLSGLAGTADVFYNPYPGFGLVSENAYLQGGIIATFGKIANWQISGSTLVSSNGNVHISSSAGGVFRMGNPPPTFVTEGIGIILSGTGEALIGNATGSRIQFTGGNLILSSSLFKIGGATSFISSSGIGLVITSPYFNVNESGSITASNVILTGNITAATGSIGGWAISPAGISTSSVHISSSLGGSIKMGSILPTSVTNGSGVVLSGSGEVLIGVATGSRIQFVGANLILSSSTFVLGGPNSYISSSGNTIAITSSKFAVDGTGNITASSGMFGTASKIYIDGDGLAARWPSGLGAAYFSGNSTFRATPTSSDQPILNASFATNLSSWQTSGNVTWFASHSVGSITGAACLSGSSGTSFGKISQSIQSVAARAYTLGVQYNFGIVYSSGDITASNDVGGDLFIGVSDGTSLLLSESVVGIPVSEDEYSYTTDYKYYTFYTTQNTPLTMSFTCTSNDEQRRVYIFDTTMSYYQTFSEMNSAGLYVFNTPQSYFKVGNGTIELIDDNVYINNMSTTHIYTPDKTSTLLFSSYGKISSLGRDYPLTCYIASSSGISSNYWKIPLMVDAASTDKVGMAFGGRYLIGIGKGLNNNLTVWGGGPNRNGPITSDLIVFTAAGKIGIGTSNPLYSLDVTGSVASALSTRVYNKSSDAAARASYILQNDSNQSIEIGIYSSGLSSYKYLSTSAGDMYLSPNSLSVIVGSLGSTALKLDGTNAAVTASKLMITNGATNGYVLTSDASGNASWAASTAVAANSGWTDVGGGTVKTTSPSASILIGSASTAGAKLHISGTLSDSNLFKVDDKNTNDILTISSSGRVVFTLGTASFVNTAGAFVIRGHGGGTNQVSSPILNYNKDVAIGDSRGTTYNSPHNSANTVRLWIGDYSNDISDNVYPIYVEDENNIVDFHLYGGNTGDTTSKRAYFGGSVGIGVSGSRVVEKLTVHGNVSASIGKFHTGVVSSKYGDSNQANFFNTDTAFTKFAFGDVEVNSYQVHIVGPDSSSAIMMTTVSSTPAVTIKKTSGADDISLNVLGYVTSSRILTYNPTPIVASKGGIQGTGSLMFTMRTSASIQSGLDADVSPEWYNVMAQSHSTAGVTTRCNLMSVNVPTDNNFVGIEGRLYGKRTGGISGSAGDGSSIGYSFVYRNITGTVSALQSNVNIGSNASGWSTSLVGVSVSGTTVILYADIPNGHSGSWVGNVKVMKF